jgi:hypothetical protein
MARFFMFGVLALVLLSGCEKPLNDTKILEEPFYRDGEVEMVVETDSDPVWPVGMVEGEPVRGFEMPMPDPQYEIKGIGDELERLILTDFKKDFKLYRIYEFPTDSTKPEVLYVFTRMKTGMFFKDAESGLSISVSPEINSYVGFADKLPGKIQSTMTTSHDGGLQWRGTKVTFYHGFIVGDYILSWHYTTLETKKYSSEIIFLERSKGDFKSEIWGKGYEYWLDNQYWKMRKAAEEAKGK